MQREILFRGKRKDNGEWAEGHYGWSMGTTFIVHVHCVMPSLSDPGGEYFEKTYEVDPETVGQFTGVLDKNGQKIFEGDLCWYTPLSIGAENDAHDNPYYHRRVVDIVFEGGSFGAWDCYRRPSFNGLFYHSISKPCNLEVIGNVFDAPELLE